MGQQFYDSTYPDCSPQKLQERIRAASPNLYFPPGKPVAQCLDQTFESRHAAWHWLVNNTHNRQPLQAVRYRYYSELTADELGPEFLAQQKAVNALRHQISNFGESVVRGVAALSEEATATCDSCGSQINVKAYLKSTRAGNTGCPVCPGNLLVKPAQAKALEQLKVQLEKAQADLDNLEVERRKLAKKDTPPLCWLVGYWDSEPRCSC